MGDDILAFGELFGGEAFEAGETGRESALVFGDVAVRRLPSVLAGGSSRLIDRLRMVFELVSVCIQLLLESDGLLSEITGGTLLLKSNASEQPLFSNVGGCGS